MESYCGANCAECENKKQQKCGGCGEACGCLYEGKCFIAEYIKAGGKTAFDAFTERLKAEINAFGIEGMPELKDLYALDGAYVNLHYPLPSGEAVPFLKNDRIYLAAQLECEFGESERCFGVVADPSFLLVATYGCNGSDPELLLYRSR
ncbi:MAG: DUF3795 domain-containing protein [Clostridiales bacterium]|nr:DUF3795 domain-containing protein [Candidatus Coliplasma caballi]